jgi:hypothetical protein
VDTNTLHVDSTNNNVGIGTSSPTLDLSVDGDIWQGNGNGVELGRVFNDSGVWHMRASGNVNGLALGTNNTERMRIDSSGVTTFKYNTKVYTGGYPEIRLGISDSNYFNLVFDNPNDLLAIGKNGGTKMSLTASGNVGIGATSPSYKLDIVETTNVSANRVRNSFATLTNAAPIVYITADRANTSAYYLLETRSGGTADREHVLRGDGSAFADGSWQGGGADYAEYFEWADGNTSNEDRRGYSVVLVGNQIRKATSSDSASDIIGVISGNPSVVGDAAWNKWNGKYNTDDFGAYILEAYTVTEWIEADGTEHSYETDKIPSDLVAPATATVITTDEDGATLTRRQLNASYDDSQTYTPREDRVEWDTVGLMGKLRLRVGQPTGSNWIKMRDTATDDSGSVTIEEWLVR